MRAVKIVTLSGLIALLVVVAAFFLYGGSLGGGKGIARIGGAFTLTDHQNRPRTHTDFRGRYMLVYFGYTYCPDICPTALQKMISAMMQLPPEQQEKITPVFISIDPERDTVQQLASYVENFHPRMVGLTGTREQIAVAARAYRVYYGRAKADDSAADYLMDHSSIVFLMNPRGDYVTHFTHATPPEKIVSLLQDKVET